MTKPEVREIARELGLPNAESKESQDACFMPPDKTAAEFLHEHFGEAVPAGDDLLVLNLPPVKPDCLVPVIELFMK